MCGRSDVHILRCRLRAEIDKLLSSDRILSLVVAIETALADERYEVQLKLNSTTSQCKRMLGCRRQQL